MGEAANDLYDALERAADRESECVHGCLGNCVHLDPEMETMPLSDETKALIEGHGLSYWHKAAKAADARIAAALERHNKGTDGSCDTCYGYEKFPCHTRRVLTGTECADLQTRPHEPCLFRPEA